MLALQGIKAFKQFSMWKTCSKMRHRPTAPLQKVTLIHVGSHSDLIKPILINTFLDWESGSEVKKDLSPWEPKPVLWPDPVLQVWWWWDALQGMAPPGSCQGIPRALLSHLHLLHRPQEENIYSFEWWLWKFYFQFIWKEFQWILIYHTSLPLEHDMSLFFNIL